MIELSDFAAIFPMRTPRVMWLLGAGVSAASGIKTAWEMIWDFKRRLYCAQTGTHIEAMPAFLDDTTRARIQRHFDGQIGYPKANHNDEYSFYFQKACPTDADRRRYIEGIVAPGTPSHGHKVLAALMAHDKVHVGWTTNFDRMLEDAAQEALKLPRRLTVASLGEPRVMRRALDENSWPVLGKIHGDFQSQNLKNTGEELLSQDEEMRDALVDACRRHGLAVAGYSGRDDSVMEALEVGLHAGRGYPDGLFWFYRAGSEEDILPRVRRLIEKAQSLAIDAHLIPIISFDELMNSVALQVEGLPAAALANLRTSTSRCVPAPIPKPGGTWPALRLNALPFDLFPSLCRLVRCDIGNTKAVLERIEQFSGEIVAMRRDAGVIAFGSDPEIERVFGGMNMERLGTFTIEPSRLRFESAEQGLLYEGLALALAREHPVWVAKRREERLMCVDHRHANDPVFEPLRRATGKLHGKLPASGLHWNEAVRWRLEWRLDTLWMLLEPTVHVERANNKEELDEAMEFSRSRLSARFNKRWYEVLKGWIYVLVGDGEQKSLRAFAIGDGLDAVYTLKRNAAFSRR